MSLIFPSFSVVPSSCLNQLKVYSLKSKGSASLNPCFPLVQYKVPWSITQDKYPVSISKPHGILTFTARDCIRTNNQSTEEKDVSFDGGDQGQEEIEETGSPWEGAVIYKRNPSVSHVEYCTTLERLGLGEHSTEISKSSASVMGLRVTKAVKDYPLGTPVQISIDVTRKKQKLRLDGIIRTVISLCCNRCGEPAAESVFSNFTLLLSEEPIEEPEVISMGAMFGDGKVKIFSGISEEEEEDDEASIDLDDRLYFPPEEREIDISKNIRDMVHVEITINAICDPSCKGMCLNCGTNLNTSSCSCRKEEVKKKSNGPLGNLKKQMQRK
ncbi:large ribosomal RNA subunit accumulation protein YCED homolog 1, chloroplastic [Corylus avellana]|uniref:large ribosomal RNA subunit accumulation protein YCED homolog 1, chloroplastic n=1 Tax=Corylus avellana TaxID=13451 RepID=UPI001E236D28|nr:large ribosomal RNA subunit accumulation protein YCED homolog 1, chloroplastic [Corylus avellana]XP_059445120.1 large ribosomal RNA subunit accumulation protein YCED homolog 1, chloroplastic [Corylus avellana]